MSNSKRMSVHGLADFMVAKHARQREIVREHKYPDEDDARARIPYYREARERITAFHAGGLPSQWLLDQAASLHALAQTSARTTATRQRQNATILRSYAQHFANRRFQVLDRVKFEIQFGEIQISVFPDLQVREKGSTKLIKLGFNSDTPEPGFISVIAQTMFEAARLQRPRLTSSAVLFLDVRRGREHRGARLGSRTRSNIIAACETISDIWDRL